MERAEWGIGKHPNIRTQRTKLQSALLSHVKQGVIHLSKKLVLLSDQGVDGVELHFQDGTVAVADLVVGADGIRSVRSGTHHQRVIDSSSSSLRLLETQHGQTMRSSSQGPPSGGHCSRGTRSRNWTIGSRRRPGGMAQRPTSTYPR